MSETTALPSGDPLNGPVVGYRSFGYDMPDEFGGGFVTGELVLRGDGVLLRRYSKFFSTPGGKLTPGHGPWEEVTWWIPERDPDRAARVLNNRGYDLHQLDAVPGREQGEPATGDPGNEAQ